MSNRLTQGTQLNNRYEIIHNLGQGGFGITYLAKDTVMNREVVIKEYFPQHLVTSRDGGTLIYGKTELFQQGKVRFLNEAQTMASLFEVPGIVKVLEFFEENDTAYIVMEYIKGITLIEWMERRDEPCSFAEAWELLRPVTDALEKMHHKGILHRDISPDNIMVSDDGTVKLMDFGASREFFMENDYEQTMTVIVKTGYAPPEQYEQKGKQGPWTDIYALCSVIYEMITGAMPQNSRDRQLSDNMHMPSLYGAVIDKEIETELINNGMALSAEKRFSSIKKMKAAFSVKASGSTSRQWNIKVIVSVIIIIAMAIVGGIIFNHNNQRPDLSADVAGSYERGSQKYNEFVAFVKENAVSHKVDPDDKESVIYTLEEDAVLEWGEKCNIYMVEEKYTDIIKGLEKRGHKVEQKNDVKSTYTVTLGQFGIIRTNFIEKRSYKCDDTFELIIESDVVSNQITYMVFYLRPEDNGDILALATDIYFILEPETEASWNDVKAILNDCVNSVVSGEADYDGASGDIFNYVCMRIEDANVKDDIAFVLQDIWCSDYYWP